MRKISPLFIFVALALFIIAVHQTMVEGFRASYPFFMFSVVFLFLFWYFKRPNDDPKNK
jgi:hypothetical protein